MSLGSRIAATLALALTLAGGLARDAEAQAYRRWYLAEGAANTFFNDTILIGNPNGTAANVTIQLLPEGQPPFAVQTLTVQPTSRATFNVNGVTGLPLGRGVGDRRVQHRHRRRALDDVARAARSAAVTARAACWRRRGSGISPRASPASSTRSS